MDDINEILIDGYNLISTNIVSVILLENRVFGNNKINDFYSTIYNSSKNNIEELNSIFKDVYERIKLLDNSKILPNDFLNLLLLLKNSKFEYVDKILEVTQYEERINELFQNIASKFYAKEKLSEDEMKIIESRLIPCFNDELLADEIIARRLFALPIVSYESFCNAIRVFILNKVKEKFGHDNYLIMIAQDSVMDMSNFSNCSGIHRDNTIIINERVIKNCYYNGDFTILNTIFHELRHEEQHQSIKKDE